MASIRCLSLLLAVMYLVSHLVFGSDEKVKQGPTYHIRENNGSIYYNFSVNTGSSDKVMSRQGGHHEREKAEEDEAEEGHGDRGKRRYEESSLFMDFVATFGLDGLFLLGVFIGSLLMSLFVFLDVILDRHTGQHNLYFLGSQRILFIGNMPNVKELSSLLVLYIACILLMVGVATNSWATAGAGASGKEGSLKDEEYRGLFKQCGGLGAQSKLLDYSGGACGDTNDHKAPKTFVVGGFFVGCLVLVTMTFYLFLKDSDSSTKIMPKVCGIAGVVAAVAILVGLVIFAIDEFGDRLSPGYSFFVTLVGALILIAGSVMSMKA